MYLSHTELLLLLYMLYKRDDNDKQDNDKVKNEPSNTVVILRAILYLFLLGFLVFRPRY